MSCGVEVRRRLRPLGELLDLQDLAARPQQVSLFPIGTALRVAASVGSQWRLVALLGDGDH